MSNGAFGLGDSAYVLDPQSGRALSVKHQRLAELIKDYEPTLELAWIPPENRGALDVDKPFAVICKPDNTHPYVVMKIREDQMDESVLAALIIRDNKHTNVLDQIEAMEFADSVTKAKEDFERTEDRKNFVATVLKSPLHTYRHGGKKYQ